MKFLTLLLSCCLLAAVGCKGPRVVPISSEKYSQRSEADVRLFVSDVQRPYKEIAFIQSFSDSESDPETRRRQLAQMRRNAARVGADAIINIRTLNSEVRGAVIDEAVPFRAYRQGEFELSFLRGVAIRYITEDGFEPMGDETDGEAVMLDDPLAFDAEADPLAVPTGEPAILE